MNERICLSAVLLVLPLTTAVAQQQPPPLEPGAWVRITAPSLGIEKQAATFQALRGDTLVVMADSTMYYPLGSITRFDVYRGQKSRVGTDALIGGIVGAAVGLGLSIAYVAGGCVDGCGDEVAVGIASVMVIGGGIGAGIGAGIGLVMGSTDRWEEVPLDRLRVSFAPQWGGGFALAISVYF